MRLTADTNILVRLVVADDPVQTKAAQDLVEGAELVAMPLLALAEMCWVLQRVYGFSKSDAALAIRALTNAANVSVDIRAVEAGLAVLDEGGDFADGAIAQDGIWLGGETFVSFDKQAVKLLQAAGQPAQLID